MFDSLLSRWRTRGGQSGSGSSSTSGGGDQLPTPATDGSKWRKRELYLGNPQAATTSNLSSSSSRNASTATISAPIPRATPTSLTGFDDYAGLWHPHSISTAHAQQQQQQQQQQQGDSPPPGTLNRPSRPQVAWLNSEESLNLSEAEELARQVVALPTPVVVAQPKASSSTHVHPMGRSVSSPPTSYPSSSSSSGSGSSTTSTVNNTGRWGLKLQTNPTFSSSTGSLGLDSQGRPLSGDLFGYANAYPLAKQLSPIAEQDYMSPESLRLPKPLPSMSSMGQAASSHSYPTNPSPNGSHQSEITRPSPVYSHPFISRQLNRTVSQTSSRTHVSTTSSVQRTTTTKSSPPNIPPLDLRPHFPGPHQSYPTNGPPLRPRRSTMPAMPTIVGSSDGYVGSVEGSSGYDAEAASLHADSFVTASDVISTHGGTRRKGDRQYDDEGEEDENDDSDEYGEEPDMDIDISEENRRYRMDRADGGIDVERGTRFAADALRPRPSKELSERNRHPSASESFISRRWDRDVSFGNGGVVTFRAKRQWISSTPAFWAFWMGFVCPFLWLIGGWHFTNFGEQPPRLTFWEFYFNAGYWKEKFCLGRDKKRSSQGMEEAGVGGEGEVGGGGSVKDGVSVGGGKKKHGKGKGVADPPLPRWVAEKQSTADGRARLYDAKRSLRGISFGYPFIPRPVEGPVVYHGRGWLGRASRRMVRILARPNRVFDLLYGVKLREVRGRPESGRRMFDPWIQRCRYAFCYALVLVCIGLFTATTYLIIYNTRQLR